MPWRLTPAPGDPVTRARALLGLPEGARLVTRPRPVRGREEEYEWDQGHETVTVRVDPRTGRVLEAHRHRRTGPFGRVVLSRRAGPGVPPPAPLRAAAAALVQRWYPDLLGHLGRPVPLAAFLPDRTDLFFPRLSSGLAVGIDGVEVGLSPEGQWQAVSLTWHDGDLGQPQPAVSADTAAERLLGLYDVALVWRLHPAARARRFVGVMREGARRPYQGGRQEPGIDAVLNYGLDVRGAVHLTKTGFDYSVVVVPQSEEARDKTKGLVQLVIHLNPDSTIRRMAVQQVSERDDGNVELSFRSGDGHLIMGAVYTAGLELVEVLGPEADGGPATIQHSPLPHDWECWRRCMLNEWNNLPDWIRATCGPICGGCLGNGFSGGACYYCSFCLAFYGGWCAGQC